MVSGGEGSEVVAYFEVRHERSGPDGSQEDVIEIFGNKQFFLGRNSDLCERSWPDSTISNQHLRIHCVLYESDPVANVPPFVYATDMSTNGTYLKKFKEACASSQSDQGILMGKGSAFLLDDEDELRISESVTLIYHEINPAEQVRLTYTQEQERPTFASRYLITGRVLGSGAGGQVLVAIRQKTQRQLACKIINLKGLYNGKSSSDQRRAFADLSQQSLSTGDKKRLPAMVTRSFREFEILENLVHPNIVRIEKVFWSLNTIYIFQELVTGGDLFSFIEYKGGRLGDVEAAVIVHQILKGVEYLHGQNIVHRDLKPDNILMTSLEDGARVVITDFGTARILPESQGPAQCQLASRARMFSMVGTLEFAAPEIHSANPMVPRDRGYSKAVDMWSIGSITAALLSGDVIFTDRAASNYPTNPMAVIVGLAARCDISIIDDEEHSIWRQVGHRPKDFIKNLLVLSENDRMTVIEALEHPWFSHGSVAAEFEALYERSIKDWEPRRKTSKLVEHIPRLPDAGQPDQTTSRHFPQSMRKASAPQSSRSFLNSKYRTQNSLSSVTETYAEAQFEGPSLDEAEHCERDGDRSVKTDSSQFPRAEDEINHSMEQLSIDTDPPASGMYSAYENAQQIYEHNGSKDQTPSGTNYEDWEESIPVVFPPGYIRRRESELERGLPYVCVYESPADEYGLPPSQTRRGKYNETSQSSIVHETSVNESGRYTHASDTAQEVSHRGAFKRSRAQGSELPSYAEFFGEQDATSTTDHEQHRADRSKRMKLR
ncbi:kinase-like protein [Massarina eburnea CBS 473.64]|uniref:Kinase-like protein n=1 Tax=Massarina eburnea CBS 473.64 TaxID=1395130 RepID=A0A6A6RTZ0_9PLEO|nr:kinase-like protein [Massarina eburnea CBS 473.64]